MEQFNNIIDTEQISQDKLLMQIDTEISNHSVKPTVINNWSKIDIKDKPIKKGEDHLKNCLKPNKYRLILHLLMKMIL